MTILYAMLFARCRCQQSHSCNAHMMEDPMREKFCTHTALADLADLRSPPIRSCYLEHFHITDIQKSYLLFGWTHELAMHSLIDCNESKRARPDLFDPVHAHDPLLLVDLERAFWSVNACLSIWATLWSGPGSETTRWSHQSS